MNSLTSNILLIDIPVKPPSYDVVNTETESALKEILIEKSRKNNDGYYDRKIKKSYSRGLLCIGEKLISNGHNVIYWNASEDKFNLSSHTTSQLNIIGISVTTPFIPYAYELAKYFKCISNKSLIIIGGVHASVLPQKTLEECEFIDCVVRGRGEETMLALASGVNPLEINNCFSRKKDISLTHFENKLIYSHPNYSILQDNISNYRINLQTKIGCNYKCSFCGNLYHKKRDVEYAHIELEFEQLSKLSPNSTIHFCDCNFLSDKNHLTRISKLISDYLPKGIRFSCDIRADTKLSLNVLRELEKIGFTKLCVGIESINDKVLKYNRKQINSNQTLELLRYIKKNSKLYIYGYWIIGLPGSSKADVIEDINHASNMIKTGLVDEMATSVSLIPLPGSQIFHNSSKYGVNILTYDWRRYFKPMRNPIYSTDELTTKDLVYLYDYYTIKMFNAYKSKLAD